ncbi:MAG TPA: LysR family transcriptional regulator [Candidatus Omnitrophota bacterium]|nr:LysR family transcriptional regulator [Candidatus Omnitrophota bacterium]
MIPFNYHHLFYFYTIAKTGSITKACETLRLAQPTLSAQLKQFENYLKVKLFEREKKKLILTEEGRQILFYATEIFNVGREMMDRIDDHSHKGRIRIQLGVSHFVPRAAVDALLKFIFKIDPDVHVSVYENTINHLMEALESHQQDIVLSDTILPGHIEKDIEHHFVAKIPISFCAHPSIAKKYKNIPKDLNGAPIILPTIQSQAYQSIQDYFITHKIKPRIIGEIQDVELIRRLVLSGIGIAPINQFTVTQAPAKEPIVILNPRAKPTIFESIYLLTKVRKKKHPLIPKIIDQFRISV